MKNRERAKFDLDLVQWWVSRLREYASVWDSPEFDEREREAFPYEWDNTVDVFEDVIAAAERGILPPTAIIELHQLAEELTELLPTMRRLQIRLPDADALQRARAASAA